jgi:hypothetical protein
MGSSQNSQTFRMGRQRSRDSRDRVDEIMQGHQLHYSLVQLRLVG